MATPAVSAQTQKNPDSRVPWIIPESRLHELLSSGGFPSDIEATHIRSITSTAPAGLVEFDDEISRLQQALHNVATERGALQEYYNSCRGVALPLPQLPSETLVEIFRLCSPVVEENVYSRVGEMMRLAKPEMLVLSQVCSRWHTLIMDVPTFWSTIHIDLDHWRKPSETDITLLGLLESTLGRGKSCPLTIHMKGSVSSLVPTVVFSLLAQHSERWLKLSITEYCSSLRDLSAARNRVPILQSLELDVLGLSSDAIDTFEIAPKLTSFTFPGPLKGVCVVPLSQLREIVSLRNWPHDVAKTMSVMTSMSRQTTFRLQLLFRNFHPADCHLMVLPAVTSDIPFLAIQVDPSLSDGVTSELLGRILDSLTLPLLHGFELSSGRYPDQPVPWVHAPFLNLAQRASFHTHLKSLDISASTITEPELIECLSELPFLQQLTISDHRPIFSYRRDHGADLVLITDTLLRRLAWVSDPSCLVPKLHHLRFPTRLEFDENVLLELILSRLTPGRTPLGPFAVEIRRLPEYSRKLNQEVLAQLDKLHSQRELYFNFARVLYD
ncbi:hypothetical protein C8J57DRAFT_1334745 [Mycena rebaudengoi]|nr:hypothetical protein C8J57DRAFT_1334745 [Mycena rebaudengoi]